MIYATCRYTPPSFFCGYFLAANSRAAAPQRGAIWGSGSVPPASEQAECGRSALFATRLIREFHAIVRPVLLLETVRLMLNYNLQLLNLCQSHPPQLLPTTVAPHYRPVSFENPCYRKIENCQGKTVCELPLSQ